MCSFQTPLQYSTHIFNEQAVFIILFQKNKPSVLLISPDDSALGQVIGGHLQCDLVSGKNADEVLTKLPADVCQDNGAVLKLYAEHGVGELLHNNSLQFDDICFGHNYLSSSGDKRRAILQ